MSLGSDGEFFAGRGGVGGGEGLLHALNTLEARMIEGSVRIRSLVIID